MSTPAWNPFDRACPSRGLVDRAGDRWTVLLVGALSDGPLRFSALATRVDGVSQKMLTQTLRGLERDGLVTRTFHAQIPPRVDYELTALGRSLGEVLLPLRAWSVSHMDDVLLNRSNYDDAHAVAQ